MQQRRVGPVEDHVEQKTVGPGLEPPGVQEPEDLAQAEIELLGHQREGEPRKQAHATTVAAPELLGEPAREGEDQERDRHQEQPRPEREAAVPVGSRGDHDQPEHG